jgi:hypothetical protein
MNKLQELNDALFELQEQFKRQTQDYLDAMALIHEAIDEIAAKATYPTHPKPAQLDPLQRLNKKGYTLLNSLNNQLRNFDNGTWQPTTQAMRKQAAEFDMDWPELCDIIRENSYLTRRFRKYPQLGV